MLRAGDNKIAYLYYYDNLEAPPEPEPDLDPISLPDSGTSASSNLNSNWYPQLVRAKSMRVPIFFAIFCEMLRLTLGSCS
jgi:hypothetical protein